MTTDLSPLARISAAIKKLERLRAESEAGPWKPGLMGHVANEQGAFADLMDWPTADLIVTLHRTIDAQLTILRYARPQVEHLPAGVTMFASCDEPGGVEAAIDLASAILGGES